MLVAASILSLLAIALACAGSAPRARRVGACRGAGASVVNLNTVADSEALEPALSLVFTNPPERRSAARELFRFLAGTARKRPAPAECRRARPRARGNRVPRRADGPAVDLRLSSRLLKPSFTVRTREAFRNQVLLFGLLYVLGFHIVSFVWRLRSVRSDALILVVCASSDRDRFRGDPRPARSAAGHLPARDAMSRAF